jgi:phosphoadenosine phosphosulfate reductase
MKMRPLLDNSKKVNYFDAYTSAVSLVRLGKIPLRWCDACNLPVLETKQCGRCGGTTRQMDITPPGDARPATAHNIAHTREVIDRQFGPGCGGAVLRDGHFALMNKAPALDRMDEVIVDGKVAGTMRYDIGRGWVFLSRMAAAKPMQSILARGKVVADDGALKPILGGSNLLAPGVLSCSEGIAAGDEVIVVDRQGRAFAAGSSRMSAAEMTAGGKGMAVKVRWYEAPEDNVGEKAASGWPEVLEANRPEMERKIAEGVNFMLRAMRERNIPAMISFSGGKDSLATFLLGTRTGKKLPLFYIDTGLEFPETVQHVREVAERHGAELIFEEAPKEAFLEGLKVFGPPGRDYRWCCKTNKLGPTVRAISKHFPSGVLSFIGQRRYESESRASKPRIWENPWTPGQIGASPIQNWTALHVWLLIMGDGEPYNPWYDRGLDRIGCYMCPASDLAELKLVEAGSEGYRSWDAVLRKRADDRGLPPEWVDCGMWRWRAVPPSIRQELEKVGISVKAEPKEDVPRDGNLKLFMQKGISPCTMGYSIEGAFDRCLHLDLVANVMNMIGEVTVNEGEGWASVNGITVFEEGALMGKDADTEKLREKVERVRRTVVKAEECVGCGVCTGRCSEGALRLELGRIHVEVGKCVHCGRCVEPCPAITFGDNAFDF